MFSVYYQSPIHIRVPGMMCEPFYTKIIELKKNNSQIFDAFDKGTKYEIRRAQLEGVICSKEESTIEIVKFYNDFAKSKKLKSLSPQDLIGNHNKLFTIAKYNNEILACHLYLVDTIIGRARLLNSGTLVSFEDKAKRASIGRANRYLHFWDINFFQNLGFIDYDLGGYAYNAKNKSLIGINSFKDSFGGVLVKEYHYFPFAIWLGLVIKQSLRTMNHQVINIIQLPMKSIIKLSSKQILHLKKID